MLVTHASSFYDKYIELYDMDMFLCEFFITKNIQSKGEDIGGEEDASCLTYSEPEVSVKQWSSKSGSQGKGSLTKELARKANLWAPPHMSRSQTSWW